MLFNPHILNNTAIVSVMTDLEVFYADNHKDHLPYYDIIYTITNSHTVLTITTVY